ncbi:MAG: aldehyde dehydrogenase family protein, partial [Bdellovibrionota bacterium]|nr:aldehyde dehydrogenase family protein [Bdellovibrionota bacterium]
RNRSFVNGSWVGDGECLSVRDKYTQKSLAEIPFLNKAQVEEAVVSSEKAFSEMASWSGGQRAEKLKNLYDLLEEKGEAFSELICKEAGKPLSYSKGEIARCLLTLNLAKEEATRFEGEKVPIDFGLGTGKTAYTRPFPIGPILAISPFNFPLNLVMHKVAPALAVGCPVILKPSPFTPLTSLAFSELVDKAGFPPGALNVLVCRDSEAENLVRDERLKALSFTGSPKVGWFLKTIAGRKKVILELGGNAAVIVDENVDVNKVAKDVCAGSFLYSGQICISTQRVYAHKKVFTDLKKALMESIKDLGVGDPTQEKNSVGPLIDQKALERIGSWVDEARSGGAEVLTGGEVLDEKRNIYAPTLLTETKREMKVVDEEVFGPLAVLESVESFEEAIENANQTRFGLQVGVYTNRIDRMKYAFNHCQTGAVIMNFVPGFRMDNMPYGGIKQSGFGREGVKYSMRDFTEERLLIY